MLGRCNEKNPSAPIADIARHAERRTSREAHVERGSTALRRVHVSDGLQLPPGVVEPVNPTAPCSAEPYLRGGGVRTMAREKRAIMQVVALSM